MEEFKSRLNSQKAIGFGRQSGYFQDTMSMDNGQQVDKSTLWKVEETSATQENSEEDHKPLALPSIGVQITSLTNTKRPMLKSHFRVAV